MQKGWTGGGSTRDLLWPLEGSKNTLIMERRTNRRGHREDFATGRHLILFDLRREAFSARVENYYLFKLYIPRYPHPEFRVSRLKHDTNQCGLLGIHESGGFRGFPHILEEGGASLDLLWWSLVVGPEDMEEAERRFLGENFPERTEEQAEMQQSFLEKFATSPAFMESSRLGSYRFSFPVEEVLKAYREQFCSGAQPVMRVFETVLYKQEVMYVVLIHRPEHEEMFSQYPLLTDEPGAVCSFKDGRFIWRSQAMCNTHSRKLVRRTEENQIEVFKGNPQFFVWDNVGLAFHVENTEVLNFDADHLRNNITTCREGRPSISLGGFDAPWFAERLIKVLWPSSSEYN